MNKENSHIEQTEIINFAAKNLKFLRQSVRLGISELASLLEIDPKVLHQFENGQLEGKYIWNLIQIANHFTVRLDVLMYDDIEAKNLIDQDWFLKLIAENILRQKVSRRKFYKEVADYDEEDIYEESSRVNSKEEVLRYTLRIMHQGQLIQKEYDELRKKGLIEKIEELE